MRYKAVIFDMDGTVLDTLEDLNSAMNHVLRLHGMPERTMEQTRLSVGNGSRYYLEHSVPAGTKEETLEEMLAEYLPYYNAHANDRTRPYPGITELIKTIRSKGCKTAIVSNKPDKTVGELSESHFAGLMDCAIGENEKGGVRRKPHPDMLLTAAEILGVSREECLFVGDSETDLETARRAEIDCVSVLWGFRTRDRLLEAGAVTLISEPEELLGLI